MAEAPPAAGAEEGPGCKCTKESWPLVLFGLGFSACVLVIIVAVSDIISPSGNGFTYIMLDIYLIIFGAIGAAAELRIFPMFRNLMFYVVKHVYFMARPIGKGIFYVFVASLTWTEEFHVLPWLAAILIGVVGLLNIGVDLIVGLPMYVDKEIQDKMNKYVAKKAISHATGGRI